MILARIVFITSLLCAYINADMAPNYPEPGTIWKTGQQYEITWCKNKQMDRNDDLFLFLIDFFFKKVDDKQSPTMEKTWKKFKIGSAINEI